MKLVFGLLFTIRLAAQTCTGTPSISGSVVTTLSSTSIQVTWNTATLGDTRGGISMNGGDEIDTITSLTDAAGATSHSVTFTNLRPSGIYELWWVSRDPANPLTNVGYCYQSGITTNAPPAGGYDYDWKIEGGHTVNQGKTLYIETDGWVISGTEPTNSSQITFSTIPTGSNIVFGNTLGCSYTYDQPTNKVTNLYNTSCGVNVGIATTAQTPVGDYNLTITRSTTGGSPANKTKTWLIHVLAPATFTYGTPSSYPPIPCLTPASKEIDGITACTANWQDSMMTYGASFCSDDTVGNESFVWYYDGLRVFQSIQLWDAVKGVTGNPSQWDTCINAQAGYYLGYVRPNNGSVPAVRVFSPGSACYFSRRGDFAYYQNSKSLRNSPYAALTDHSLITYNFARELAYRVDTEEIDVSLGRDTTRVPYLMKGIDIELGRPDQWMSGISYQPYQVGLWAESLILCFENQSCPYYQDARIPTAVKQMADYLWTNAWNLPGQPNAFVYNYAQWQIGLFNPLWQNLNQLVAFIYAWLFHITGDVTYRSEFDQIFQAAAEYTPSLGPGLQGKTFSQTYRMSFKAVEWRSGDYSTSLICGGDRSWK